jgi:hypothetical protein
MKTLVAKALAIMAQHGVVQHGMGCLHSASAVYPLGSCQTLAAKIIKSGLDLFSRGLWYRRRADPAPTTVHVPMQVPACMRIGPSFYVRSRSNNHLRRFTSSLARHKLARQGDFY